MKTKISNKTAKVHEIFVSIQGEGLFVGEKQIFFRFSRCNMACTYCDTDNSIGTVQNIEQIIQDCEKLFWLHEDIKSITLTGGEPLLYPETVKEISDWAHSMGLRVFLETNGTIPEALEKVASSVDIVSLDLKIPSVGNTDEFWAEHKKFIQVIKYRGLFYYIKLVLSDKTDLRELYQALSLIPSIGVSVFLQPVTKLNGVKPPSEDQLAEFKELALSKLFDVRIQPQWHKVWNIK